MAIRYGTGLRRRCSTMRSTSGVSTRQMVSLTRKADSTPAVATTAASSGSGRRARPTTQAVTTSKNPASRRLATTIIMPSSRAMVSKSMAR